MQHLLWKGCLYLQTERKMSTDKKTPFSPAYFRKLCSAILMCGCLLFLTGANFVVYAEFFFNEQAHASTAKKTIEAPTPVEENTNSCKLPIVQEEYLHEKDHLKEFAWLTILLQHQITDAEKLQVVHYELESPPPKV